MPSNRDFTAIYYNGVPVSRTMVGGAQTWPLSSTPPTVNNYDALYAAGFTPTTDTVLRTTPLNVAVPAKYTSIETPSLRDPTFGSALFRATDIAIDIDPASTTSRLRHEYARRGAFNCDNSLFVCNNGGGAYFVFQVSNGAKVPGNRADGALGNPSGAATFPNVFPSDPCDWQWDATDPDVLWFKPKGKGWKVYTINVRTGVITLKRDLETKVRAIFPDADGFNSGGEGRPSTNNRYWGGKCGVMSTSSPGSDTPHGLFVYDMETDTVTGSVPISGNPNWTTLSATGDYILAAWFTSKTTTLTLADCQNNAGPGFKGVQCWTRDFTTRRALHTDTEHADVGVLADGREVLVTNNYRAESQVGIAEGWVFMAELATGARTLLVQNYGGTQSNQHVSCGSNLKRPGYFVWSVYHDSRRGETVYKDGTVCVVELKATPKVTRIAHHRAVRTTYQEEPHAVASPDGLLVMFASTWNDGPDDTTPNIKPHSFFAALHSSVYG